MFYVHLAHGQLQKHLILYVYFKINRIEFIDDTERVEKENARRIGNKEFYDENIQWLEEKLASVNEELSRRTRMPLPSGDENKATRNNESKGFHSDQRGKENEL
jgi:hypothetical protein